MKLNPTLRSALITITSFIFVITALNAWTGPSGTPPSGNVEAPVNVGEVGQVKNGNFGVAAFIADSVSVGTDTSTINTNTINGTVSAITSPKFCIGDSCITSWPTGGEGGGIMGGVVGYGGMFVWGSGVNNYGLPTPCKRPNIITGTCTCPNGYETKLAGYGAYYWWNSWDDVTWSFVCESTSGIGGGDIWTNIDITNNSTKFDDRCEYVFTTNGVPHRATGIGPDYIQKLIVDIDTNTTLTTYTVRYNAKNTAKVDQSNWSNNTHYPNQVVSEIKEKCP